ncbi:hypothetical protein BH23BAC4_BH23BAC4_01410 [soil metagenome]
MDDHPDREDQEPGLPADKRRTPDPHRGEPLPPPQEGVRPEAEGTVRPDQDEPYGPMAELFGATATELKARYTDDPEAQAEAERLGVENENVEAGQMLALVIGIIFTVIFITVFVFYLFSTRWSGEQESRQATVTEMAGARELRIRATDAMGHYATSVEGTDTTFTIPISRAMALVAADYSQQQPGLAPRQGTRAAFNLSHLFPDISSAAPRAVSTAEAETGAEPTTLVEPEEEQEVAAPQIEDPAPEPVADQDLLQDQGQ